MNIFWETGSTLCGDFIAMNTKMHSGILSSLCILNHLFFLGVQLHFTIDHLCNHSPFSPLLRSTSWQHFKIPFHSTRFIVRGGISCPM